MNTLYTPGIARVHYDSIQNGRRFQADYIAALEGAYATAVAICDGAGDDPDAAEAAQIAAQVAAAVTGSTASPIEGLRAAQTYVSGRNLEAPPGQEGITTAVVASIRYGAVELAWAGDSPAWAVCHDGLVVPLTVPSCHPCNTPCNVDETHHTADSEWPHRLYKLSDDYHRLIVASDGLTAHLPGRADHMTALLDYLTDAAAPDLDGGAIASELLHMTKRKGGRDNTTVAVIDLIHDTDDTN